MTKTVVGLFDEHRGARRAVVGLAESGIPSRYYDTYARRG
jgi:hypothetical protein